MTVLPLLWLTAAVIAAPPSKPPPQGPVRLLRDEPLLQTAVTVDAVEQPLGEVLANLSSSLKLDLTAEQDVSDQRVTLHVMHQPLFLFMERLAALLSHDSERFHGYHWGAISRSHNPRADYRLWRDAASVAREDEARNYPRQELAVLIRDERHMALLPPEELAAYQSVVPYKNPDPDDPFVKAFRGLTDDQIASLVDGDSVPLDPSLFATERGALGPEVRDQIRPAIRVTSADDEGASPDRATEFEVHLDGILSDALVLDTNDTTKNRDPSHVPLPEDAGPRIDLRPLLSAKTVTAQQRGDLGFTLQALSHAANITLYQESFLRSRLTDGTPHAGLVPLTGSVPRLIAEICSLWDYQALRVGNDYVLWSRTWAQDRATDVPERLIATWRTRFLKNGRLGFNDRAEIATTLTWPQVALTLSRALPESGPWDSVLTYKVLNVFGSLTPSEQEQAFSQEGLALSEMTVRGQAALADDYRSRLRAVPGDRLSQATLKYRTEDDAGQKISRLIMSVDADDQTLLGGRCIMPISAGVMPISAGVMGKSVK